jgi:hypothetical protein
MREPQLQRLFHQMANPPQSRSDGAFEGNSVSELRTRSYTEFAEFFNDIQFIPHFAVDVKLWVNVDIDVSRPPFQKPWTWVAQTMTEIKRKMTIAMNRFNASGKLVNGQDDMPRDLEFWSQFCHGDPVIFYIYMAWDHGRDIPQWNSAMLPEDQRIDIGGGAPEVESQSQVQHNPTPPSGSGKKRGRAMDDDLNDFVELQSQLFKSIVSNPPTCSTNPEAIVECRKATKIDALSRSAQTLRSELKAMNEDRALLQGLPDHHAFDYEGCVLKMKLQLASVITQMAQVME